MELSHIDESGRANMVDVSEKNVTLREALAEGKVSMSPETFQLIQGGGIAKGEVLAAARLAGIMGAKETGRLIPLCHTIPIEKVAVDFEMDCEKNTVIIRSRARTTAKTGIEMEALTAVTVAALTIYDMCKAVDKAMVISNVRLLKKSGGKSDYNITNDTSERD